MSSKKTLVIGVSTNPEQYSNLAVNRLLDANHPVVGIGREHFDIRGTHIQTEMIHMDDIHTITLYLNPLRQQTYYNYILALHPKRIVFNPGAENEPFRKQAESLGIEAINACTLVMLATGLY